MKQKMIMFVLMLFVSLSCFTDEVFKCRKETYFYENYEGRTYSKEFYFINNFVIHPYNYSGRKYIIFYEKYEEGNSTYYYSFGQYYPTYLGNGNFSEVAYGVGDAPPTRDLKIEEIEYSKTDFYRILVDEFYQSYLSKGSSSAFDCLEDFISIVGIFSKEDLRILRNAIYAKYGYKFHSKDLNEIFSKKEWYTPNEYFEENFSRLDSSLLSIIKLAEKWY